MIGFVFKTLFWVGLVWVAIGKPMNLDTMSFDRQKPNAQLATLTEIKNNSLTQLETVKNNALSIVKVCEITNFHAYCQHSKMLESAANALPNVNKTEQLLAPVSLVAVPKPRIAPNSTHVLGLNVPALPLPPMRPHLIANVPVQL
jgi:DNA-binding Xre family transcriptional regulator